MIVINPPVPNVPYMGPNVPYREHGQADSVENNMKMIGHSLKEKKKKPDLTNL